MADTKKELRASFIKQFETLLTTAFGLVAALAWNGAIQDIFKDIFGTTTATVPTIIYAIVVTIIAVVVIYYISKVAERFNG